MSLNLINGYEDTLSRYNLCPNGQFIVNQRGLFGSLADAKANDFLADMWYAQTITMDYCQAQQYPAGVLRLKGRGKKGQLIYVFNRETDSLGAVADGHLYDSSSDARGVITAACVLYVAVTSVPVSLVVSPRYATSAYTTVYDLPATCIPGKGQGSAGLDFQAVNVKKTKTYAVNQPAYFVVTLLADGEFDFYLYNFRELLGAYRNPPSAVVHPAEDLQRCERYFQQTVASVRAPLTLIGGNLVLTIPADMRVTMAGTPTAVTTLGVIDLHQLASAGAGVTVGDQANWGVIGHTAAPNFVTVGLQRAGTVANRDTASLAFSTTLTV